MNTRSLLPHLLFLALVCLISPSCSDQFYGSGDQQSTHVSEVSTIYQVEPEEAAEVNLSELVSEVDYTFLELPDDMYFRETQKVVFHGEDIFILDRAIQARDASIFCFDKSGSFNYVINQVGRGPEEYVNINDFGLTDIHIIINDGTKFLYYDIKTGKFIRSTKEENRRSFISFAFIDEESVVVDGGRYERNKSKNQIKVFTKDHEGPVHEAVPFNDHSLGLDYKYRYFFNYGDSLSTMPMYSNIVYRILSKEGNYEIKPAYELDFGDSWIPEKLLANSYRNRNRFFDANTEFVHTPDVFETNHLIYTFYKLHREDHVFINDRRSGESLNIKGFTNNTIGWFGKPLSTDGDWIVNLVAPYQIEDAGITPGEELQSILNQTNDIGQPILVKAKFKVE